MRTLLILLAFNLSFLSVIAQRSQIAHINTVALWEIMPEKKAADSTLMALNKQYSDHFMKVNSDIESLILKYQNDNSLTPTIKADMAAEIQEKQVRLEKFKKDAENDLANKREELLAPIRKKMQEAVDKVAKKNKYLYVLDSSFGNIIYTQNPADDIFELVKKELGL